MAQLDTLDIIVLAVLLAGSVAYFPKGTDWARTMPLDWQKRDIRDLD